MTPARAREAFGKVRGLCFDIDDTLSTDGKLTAEAYAALWRLREAGFAVIPVTGRPAGWCDQIARFWPVDAVVGENGAFTFYPEKAQDRTVLRRIETPGADPERAKHMKVLEAKIREAFPEARWASDQPYREYDLAIDVCEEVEPWPFDAIERLMELCDAQGAHVKLSSIHVNAWFGSYTKRQGLEYWVSRGCPGLRKPLKWESLAFVGDSPNDEPLFEAFPLSVGVANLKRYLPRLKHPPRYLTQGASGHGFAELTEVLLMARKGRK